MCGELGESTSTQEDLGRFHLRRGMTESETSTLAELVNSDWLHSRPHSYILYEFVIAKAFCVHRGHIGAYASLPDIAHSRKAVI